MIRVLRILLPVFLLAQAVLAGSFGIGISGGYEYPIVQKDQDNGTVVGIRARLKAVRGIAFEPNVYFTKFGYPEFEDNTSDLEGSKVTAYGVDVILGGAFGATGFRPYYSAGVGMYNVKRNQSGQSDRRLGWSAGLGFEVGLATFLSLDFRARGIIIPTEGGGSKKSASLTGGINYYFGM